MRSRTSPLRVKLATGESLVGVVHDRGQNQVLGRDQLGILNAAIVHAEEGLRTGIYEPKPGWARLYPEWDHQGDSYAVDFPLAGAEVVA
jgi:hypothetical protein